jgi:peptidyl-prolyl cis-trans isomerase D
MLEYFRKASSSWLFRGFFLVLAIAFGFLWGIGDFIYKMGGGGGQTVITVGPVKVTAREFEIDVYRQMELLQNQTGQKIDREQAHQIGIDAQVLNRLVNSTILELEGKRLGIIASDNQVRKTIFNEKFFQNSKGAFDKDKFHAIISKLGFTEQTYIDQLRKDILRAEIVKAIALGVEAPEFYASILYRWQSEIRQISAVMIQSHPSLVKETPNEETLRNFYVDNKELFKTPELRTIRALVIDPTKVMKEIEISDDKALEEFNAQQSEYEGKAFDKVKDQIKTLLKKQQASERIYKLSTEIEDAYSGGEKLEEITKRYGFAISTLFKLDMNGKPDPFSANASTPSLSLLDQSILKQSFTQELGTLGDMVEAEDGKFFMAVVDEIIPSQQKPFAEIKDQAIPYWKKRQAVNEAKKLASTIAKDVEKSGDINAISSRYNLKTISAKVSRRGPVAPSTLKLPESLLERIYSVTKGKAVFGAISENGETNYLVAVVSNIQQPQVDEKSKDVEKFNTFLSTALIEDILEEYVFSLRKRYPVEINKRYFKES